jgi:hypothetical protein
MTMKSRFRIHYCVPPENQYLIAEIYDGNEHLGELNTEQDQLRVVVFPRSENRPWDWPLEEFLKCLQVAEAELKTRSVFFDGQ